MSKLTVKEDKIQFQKEQDEVLSFILNERFFKPWRARYGNPDIQHKSLQPDSRLEIYLTSTCNQHCEYCYLIKYPEIYPKEFLNPQLILKNLRILYDWILDNNFYIPEADIFTGEIWHTQFGLDVLQLTLEYIQKGMQIKCFIVPSNCSFVLDEKQTCTIERYIKLFQQYGSYLMYSISVDGKIIEQESRPTNGEDKRTDEFYDRLILFAKHNNFCFHPMVASKTVSKWIDNYKWWREKLEEYDLDIRKTHMLLEVRNDDWTPETIKEYCNFMKFLIDEEVKYYNGDIGRFVCQFFGTENQETARTGYTPFFLIESDTFAGCSVATTMTVRIGDLAIPPCHRTAYNKLLYGHFIVEDDQIVGIKSNNIYTATRVLMTNNIAGHFRCDTCKYSPFCLRGCFGSQYEHNGDAFMPIPCVCEFFRKKYHFIASYFKEIGVLDYINSINHYDEFYYDLRKMGDWIEMILQEEED